MSAEYLETLLVIALSRVGKDITARSAVEELHAAALSYQIKTEKLDRALRKLREETANILSRAIADITEKALLYTSHMPVELTPAALIPPEEMRKKMTVIDGGKHE